jgi:hypothetical protein
VVSADGSGVVSHAGARLLGDLAEQITLTDLATAIADGGSSSMTGRATARRAAV